MRSWVLRPRIPGDPRSCQMDGRMISTNIDSLFNRSCKKSPDRVSGHTLRWFCQPRFREINQLAFYQIYQAYLPPCMKVHIYSVRNFVSLFNGREIFWFCHDASRWWQGHHHPTGSCQRSWEVTCRHFIPVFSLCRWRNVGLGRLLE